MESADEQRFSKNVSINGLHDSCARVGGLLRCGLRHIDLRIHGEQLKRVVMVWSSRGARTHVPVGTETHLTCAVRELGGRGDTFLQTG